MRLSDCLFSPFPHLVLFRVFPLSLLLLPEPGPAPLPLPCGLHRGKIPLALRQLRSLANWSIIYLSQGMSPKFFDDYHFSETTEIFIQEQSSDTVPSYLHDAELSDETIGRALSSPLFIQEREEPAGRRQACNSPEDSLLSSQSLSVGHVRTGRPVDEFGSLISNVRQNPCRDSENEQIRILLERQKEQILANCRAEIQKHEFQADYVRRSIQQMNGIIESQQGEINRVLEGDEQLRRD